MKSKRAFKIKEHLEAKLQKIELIRHQMDSLATEEEYDDLENTVAEMYTENDNELLDYEEAKNAN